MLGSILNILIKLIFVLWIFFGGVLFFFSYLTILPIVLINILYSNFKKFIIKKRSH